MSTVRLPAPFLRYACQRSLVCCRNPVRAPCDEADEARIVKVLASTDAGRAHLPILQDNFEQTGGVRVFKHIGDNCVHLDAPAAPSEVEPSCALHTLGGVEALSLACRNFPRWIAQLPDEPASDRSDAPGQPAAALEALFLLACPTAAALLVADPSPFRFVEVPRETWIYAVSRVATRDEVAQVHDLRAGWWRVLADRRGDTERLLAALAALSNDPLNPPSSEPGLAPELPDPLLRGLRSVDAHFVLEALERLPDRGFTYASVHWDLRRDLTVDLTPRGLLDALDVAPELLAAYLDHLLPFAVLHDTRPAHEWLRTGVRRTIAVARLVDSLLTRVPFGVNTLFADAFASTMHLYALQLPTDG